MDPRKIRKTGAGAPADRQRGPESQDFADGFRDSSNRNRPDPTWDIFLRVKVCPVVSRPASGELGHISQVECVSAPSERHAERRDRTRTPPCLAADSINADPENTKPLAIRPAMRMNGS